MGVHRLREAARRLRNHCWRLALLLFQTSARRITYQEPSISYHGTFCGCSHSFVLKARAFGLPTDALHSGRCTIWNVRTSSECTLSRQQFPQGTSTLTWGLHQCLCTLLVHICSISFSFTCLCPP